MQTSQTAEFELYEYYERSRLEALLNSHLLREQWNDDDLTKYHNKYYRNQFQNEVKQIEWILNNINEDGLLKVKYVRSNRVGRYYISGKVSLTILRRVVRNYLCDGIYYDFDIKQANLSIMMHLIAKYNIQGVETIKHYHSNYDNWKRAIKNEFMLNDEQFKDMMISIVFGFDCRDKLDSLKKKYKIESMSNTSNPLTNFIKNLKTLTTELQKLNIWDINTSEKSYNQQGSWLSQCIQTIEADIVVGLKDYLIQNHQVTFKFKNKNVGAYEYDGVKPLSSNIDKLGLTTTLEIISTWLSNNGYRYIEFANKSMNEKLRIETTELKMSSEEIENEPDSENNEIEFVEPSNTMMENNLKQSPVTVSNSFSPIVVEKKSQINPLEILQGLENESFTSGLLSELFIKLYPNDWISNGGVLYGWNGIYWESGVEVNVKITRKIDQDFVDELMKYSQSLPKISEYHIKVIATLIKKISSIRQLSFRKSLIEDITTFSSKNITFNTDPFKLAFNNKIFDLKTGLEIIPNKEDYISITTGYDWIEPTHQQMADLNEIIRKIQPYEDTRDFYLAILSTGLVGIQLQNIFILTGKGGNGKSIIDDLMLSATGNYGYKIPSKLLQEEFKTGVNPEVNNLNYKRFVLGQEPSQSKTICCNVMKELTGSANLNARNIYSSKCDVILLLSLFLECNKLPNLDEVNEAIERRVAVIPFPSKFISDDKYNDLISSGETDETLKTKNIHKKNVEYTTIPFRNANRCALLKILMPYVQTFIECNNNIPKLPNAVKIASSNYLKQSDPIYEWFIENYERKEKSIIYEADIHTNFKSSEYYSKLPKKTQRDLKKENFIDNLKSNLFLSNILQPKLRDEYVDLGLPKTTKIKKDGFYGWAKKSREEEIEVK